MSHTIGAPPGPKPLGARQAQKQRTRQALLDAGLRLLEHQSLSSLGLRAVTREVGVAPAGFYRHFRDMEDLGVALVEESFGSLRELVRALRGRRARPDEMIDGTVEVIAAYVHDHRAHFRFIARERHGGVRRVREAIAAELALFADDLAGDLADRPESDGWTGSDLRMLADLYVDHMVLTAAAFLEAPPDDPAATEAIADAARRQLRLIHLGRSHWLDG
ncbi:MULTISPECIES: TetR family transcriptional regulator [Streptomycetaceae]|uniref:TetR-family transcriptional regulator n=1 Tax=Streptantibioticus cattleyicolor (strain ATCC 35852 / DSM 46488 / JCM 4925 / NBRC 14057 / NRRL 8057) TaxID=1003195 RepID=F8K1E9_STREN|nr:TetR family transcriptional regulator [Streptantibioticus cattleyicolor]AEW97445.1 TetR-family transcriptional regulator [Streptantibioticus cattleyicolor NRRL 8057 = DSM 46488]MYS61881.1 TetR family transcriptional regulator [Streptomyces sp. SID5468]CCB77764.1 TetR-family transcriptional regulator [Streptantibioticus cattleyicolor NRRL 8057 = DSM 46488]